MIHCFQAGYGLAAFGVGPLTSAGIGLSAIFAACAAVAAVMGGLSLLAAHHQPSPAADHPDAPVTGRSGADSATSTLDGVGFRGPGEAERISRRTAR
jgi:hypothetical protein